MQRTDRTEVPMMHEGAHAEGSRDQGTRRGTGNVDLAFPRMRSECENKAAEEAREQSLAQAAQAALPKRP